MRGRSVNTHVGLVHGISTTAAAGRVNFALSLVRDHPALVRLLADALVSEWHLRTVLAATEGLSAANKTLVARQLAVDVRARHSRGVHGSTAPATRSVMELELTLMMQRGSTSG
jgi:hypothetical protein